MAPSIPDRWIPYKACGNVIEGTRIICFKVPLKTIVQAKVVSADNIWDIKTVLKTIPKLRAVIDLTNTARYYDPEEFRRAGIAHTKMMVEGRQLPRESKVKEFFDVVDFYLGVDADSLIGVHCTHGLNRTGYMVCRYMRDRLGIPANEAIERFEEARGYKIERDNYIACLLSRNPPPPDFRKDTIVKPIVKRQEDKDNKYESSFKKVGNNSLHGKSRWNSKN